MVQIIQMLKLKVKFYKMVGLMIYLHIKTVDILTSQPSIRETLLQDEKDTFYKMIKNDNETKTCLSIPLANNQMIYLHIKTAFILEFQKDMMAK